MKEQKTTKWSNFNPLCLARHVLRNLWMTVLAGLICVMAVYLLQTLVSKPSYDSQVTFAVTSRSASATASGSIAVTDSVASQFGELLQDGCFYRDNMRSRATPSAPPLPPKWA